jgi:hypothetical protein
LLADDVNEGLCLNEEATMGVVDGGNRLVLYDDADEDDADDDDDDVEEEDVHEWALVFDTELDMLAAAADADAVATDCSCCCLLRFDDDDTSDEELSTFNELAISRLSARLFDERVDDDETSCVALLFRLLLLLLLLLLF